MYMDKSERELRVRVTRDLQLGAIPDAIWDFLVGDGWVADVLQHPHEYESLKRRVRRLRKLVDDVHGHAAWKPWSTKTVDDAFSPYVQLRTKSTRDPLPSERDGWQHAVIFGRISDGRIVVEAEPWVPVRSVERYYRELQCLVLDRERNRPIKEKNLELYSWVTRRLKERLERGERREKWREMMVLWNRYRRKWRYKEVSNFHRDYCRVRDNIERLRAQAESLEHELGS